MFGKDDVLLSPIFNLISNIKIERIYNIYSFANLQILLTPLTSIVLIQLSNQEICSDPSSTLFDLNPPLQLSNQEICSDPSSTLFDLKPSVIT